MSASALDPAEGAVLGVPAHPMVNNEAPELGLPVHKLADDVSNPSAVTSPAIVPEDVVPLVKADASNADVSDEIAHYPELDKAPTAVEEPTNDQTESEPPAEHALTIDNKETAVDQVEVALHKIEDTQDIPVLDVDTSASDPVAVHNVVDTTLNEKTNENNVFVKETEGDDTADIPATEVVTIAEHGEPASDESVVPVADTTEEDTTDKSINDSAIEIPPTSVVEKDDDDAKDDVAPTDKPIVEPAEAEAENHVEVVKADDTNVSTVGGEDAPGETSYAQNGEGPVTEEAPHVVEELKDISDVDVVATHTEEGAAVPDEPSETNGDDSPVPLALSEESRSMENDIAGRTDVNEDISTEPAADTKATEDPVTIETAVAVPEVVTGTEEGKPQDMPQEDVVVGQLQVGEVPAVSEANPPQEGDTEAAATNEITPGTTTVAEEGQEDKLLAEPVPSVEATEPTVEGEQAKEEAFVEEDGIVHEAESPAGNSNKVNGHEEVFEYVPKEEPAVVLEVEETALVSETAAEEEPTVGRAAETHEDTQIDNSTDAGEVVKPAAAVETSVVDTTEVVTPEDGASPNAIDEEVAAPSVDVETAVVQGIEESPEDVTSLAEAEPVKVGDGAVTSDEASAPVEAEPVVVAEEVPTAVLEADPESVTQPGPEAEVERDPASDDSQLAVEPTDGDVITEAQGEETAEQPVEPVTIQGVQDDVKETATIADGLEGGATPEAALAEVVSAELEVTDEAPAQGKEVLPETDIKDNAEVVLEDPLVALATTAPEGTLSGIVLDLKVDAQAGEETVDEATKLASAESGQPSDVSESHEGAAAPVVEVIDEGAVAEDVVPDASVSSTSVGEEILAATAELKQQDTVHAEEAIHIEDESIAVDGTRIHDLNTEVLSIETSLDTTLYTPVIDSGIELKEQETRPSQLLSIAEEIERPKSPWAPSFQVTTVGGDVSQGDEAVVEAPIGDVATSLESVEVTAGTDEPVNIPALDIEHISVTEEVVSVDGQSQEPGRLWTPSYSVHSQGSPTQEKLELVEEARVNDHPTFAEELNDAESVVPEITPGQVESDGVVAPKDEYFKEEVIDQHVHSDQGVEAAPILVEDGPNNVVEAKGELTSEPVVAFVDEDTAAVPVSDEQVEAADLVTEAVAEQPVEHATESHSDEVDENDANITGQHSAEVSTAAPVIAERDGQVIVSTSDQVEPGTTDETEPPAGPWTPSYSVHSQGSPVVQSMELDEAPVLDAGSGDPSALAEPAALESPAEQQTPLVMPKELEGTAEAEAEAVEVTAPSEATILQPPEESWTPSYSVHSQGSPMVAPKEIDEISADVAEGPGEPIDVSSTETSFTGLTSSLSSIVNLQGSILKEVGFSSFDFEDRVILADENGSSVVVQPLDQDNEVEEVVAITTSDVEAQDQVHLANDKLEMPERPWAPSYSVHAQGSPVTSAGATVTAVEEPSIHVPSDTDHVERTEVEALSVDPEPAPTTDVEPDVDQTTVTAVSALDGDASGNASDVLQQHKGTWTPSYSVTNQGASLTHEQEESNNVESLPQSTSDEEASVTSDPELNEAQESESNALQSRASYTVAGAEDLAKNEQFILFGLRAIAAYLWVLPKWLSMGSSKHNQREPSSSSSTSSKFFPGGWFTPKPNEGRTSFDVAQGEFATLSKTTVSSSDVFETLGPEAAATTSILDTTTDGDDGQKRKWCIVM